MYGKIDKLINTIFSASIIIIIFILFSIKAECPMKKDTVTLDLEKFSGEWFVVSATPPNGKSLSKCGRFIVTKISSDAFVMNYTAIKDGRKEPFTFIVNASLDDDVTGNWQMQGSNRILGPLKHRIIEANNNSHYAMIVCDNSNGNLPVREFLMILSREKTLPSSILNELKTKASAFIDGNKILNVDHGDC